MLFHSLVGALHFHRSPPVTGSGAPSSPAPARSSATSKPATPSTSTASPGTFAGLLSLFVEPLATPFFLSTFSAGAELLGCSRFDDQLAFVDFLFTDVNPDPALLHPARAGRVPGARAAFRAVLLHPDPVRALPADAAPQDPRLSPHWNREEFKNDSFLFPNFLFLFTFSFLFIISMIYAPNRLFFPSLSGIYSIEAN